MSIQSGPPDSPAFEIRQRLDEEMAYFKQMAMQETERWIEAVTKKRFKYPDDPRRSLQDGILLCDLVNALKPGCIRKINRLPTPIAFLDNITVFQNACRCDFGLQESQLFDIKDLEDLALRGVLESEQEIQYETGKRLKNVVITIFWLGRAVRRWFKGPMLDFSSFTDIIDMSHSSQTSSFRTPSEAGFTPSSVERNLSSKVLVPQSEQLSFERVTRYLESKPSYSSYPSGSDFSDNLSGTESLRHSEGFDMEPFGDLEFNNSYGRGKSSALQRGSMPSKQGEQVNRERKADRHLNGGRDFNLKVQSADLAVASKEPISGNNRFREGISSGNFDDQSGRIATTVNTARSPLSPSSSGVLPVVNPLQFVKADSNPLAENAKQTINLLHQQSIKQTPTPEEGDWEAKLNDWKLRRRSRSKSQTFESEESTDQSHTSKKKEPCEVVVQSSVDDMNEPNVKKQQEEEEMLKVFGFTKLPERSATKPKVAKKTWESQSSRSKDWKDEEKQTVVQQGQTSDIQRNQENTELLRQSISHVNQSKDEVQTDFGDQRKKCIEKNIKISQRPKHDKGFGFTIKGGKEFGIPITVDKVHLGGAADVCDLMSKDEIFAINGAELANHYLESVRAVIDQAVHSGQVELAIRRTLSDKMLEETEGDVFNTEDEEFIDDDFNLDEDQTSNQLQSGLEEMLRPHTPVPPPDDDDEPPPLPSAPPPMPNWNTFPDKGAAYAPAVDINFFDDEPGEDTIRESVTITKLGAPPPPAAVEKLLKSGFDNPSPTHESSELDKSEMLRKRIDFFGLKAEDSEEYKQILEEKQKRESRTLQSDTTRKSNVPMNGREVSIQSPNEPYVKSDERMFALVIKPSETERPPLLMSPPPFKMKESDKSGRPENTGRSVPFCSEEEKLRHKGTVESSSYLKKEPSEKGSGSLGEERIGIKNHAIPNEDLTAAGKDRNQWISSEKEIHVDRKEDLESREIRRQGMTKNISSHADQQRHIENYSQPIEKSKGWKSMEMLRSISAVEFDPMERASKDYLSLMMTRPKQNLEMINRNYFDLNGDLKRMEEWNKKQEQKRKEGRNFNLDINQNWNQEQFDREQDELRFQHESALREATEKEKEKQKQEELLLEKEIEWKHQLEQIQRKRDEELMKKEKEERARKKISDEKLKKEMEARELFFNQSALIHSMDDTRPNPVMKTSLNNYCVRNETKAQHEDVEVITGKVELKFLDLSPRNAVLETLPDSVHASTESLSSSTQVDIFGNDNHTYMERIIEREAVTKSNDKDLFKFQGQTVEQKKMSEERWSTEMDMSNIYQQNAITDSKHMSIGKAEVTILPATTEKVDRDERPGRSARDIREEALQMSRRADSGILTEQIREPQKATNKSLAMKTTPSDVHQQPLTHEALQDFSALPKSRILDTSGESWSFSHQQQLDENETNKMRMHERELMLQRNKDINPTLASSVNKPAVPARSDSLKQAVPSQIPSDDEPWLKEGYLSSSSVTIAGRSSSASQNVLHGAANASLMKSATAGGDANVPPQLNYPIMFQSNTGTSVENSRQPSSASQHLNARFTDPPPSSHISLVPITTPPSQKYPLNTEQFDVKRNSGVGIRTIPLKQGLAGPLKAHEVQMRSASYSVSQMPRTRPYSSDYSFEASRFGPFSSLLPGPAVPYQRDLHGLDNASEAASEAVDLLFAYHQNPPPKDDASHPGRSRPMSQILQPSTMMTTTTTSQGLSSDGKQKCSGCDKELGLGRCIVLDLDFCFHPECFQCSVCRTSLHNLSFRNDIRVLASKLHCRNCYTNEQEGLKYSKV